MATANVFFHDESGTSKIVMEGEELEDFAQFAPVRGKVIINTPTLKVFEAHPDEVDAEGTTTIFIQVTEGLLPL